MDGPSIGERVREERESRGWSARTLAQKAGVSHAWVSHLEGGLYSRPGVENLGKVAVAMGVGLEALAGWEVENEVARGAGGLGEIQVNLMTIGRLDPGALEQVASIIAAVREKVERESEQVAAREKRERREERRAEQRERRDTR